MACVGILEDDQTLLAALKSHLEDHGLDVLAASTVRQFKSCILGAKFDLVVLDLALEGVPYRGLDLIKDIRQSRNVPIIVISGHTQPWDRLKALELGIDDYITKPFLMGEVLIRVDRTLKRYKPKLESRLGDEHGIGFTFSGFRLDHVRRTVRAPDGSLLDLTETEFNILNLMVQSPGRIISRDELWLALRGEPRAHVDRTLDGHIARLRRKLEPGADRPGLIKSVRGVGYVLAVPVSQAAS